MISLSKYFSSLIQTSGHRVLKVMGYLGAATADLAMPFGEDSCPVKGMDAIYATTGSDELPVVIGYINTNQMAGPGEKRQFSLKAITTDGKTNYVVAFYTHMKNDGTYELGGNTNHLLRYEQLNTALQSQVNKLQTQLNLIATGIATAGGSYTPGDISLDISAAKIDEIKTL